MTSAMICFPPPCARRERLDITPSRSVCRQLFGPVNHEQLKADLQREKRKMCDENIQRWNFDFENGVPLVGRYRWQKMHYSFPRENDPNQNLAVLESSEQYDSTATTCVCSRGSTPTTTSTTTTSKLPNVSNDSNYSEGERVVSGSDKKNTVKPSKGIRKRNSSGKITDFLRTKKHRAVEKKTKISKRTRRPQQTSMDRFFRKQ